MRENCASLSDGDAGRFFPRANCRSSYVWNSFDTGTSRDWQKCLSASKKSSIGLCRATRPLGARRPNSTGQPSGAASAFSAPDFEEGEEGAESSKS